MGINIHKLRENIGGIVIPTKFAYFPRDLASRFLNGHDITVLVNLD